ncbi:MAG TPA: phenylalanine--tRNA ligase beta subunit-related protein [Anaeromyxobacter sp.]|nr:phenylalanine--tRNA ligase beta subunit-related protein [Anaeromyxobacter sp.]
MREPRPDGHRYDMRLFVEDEVRALGIGAVAAVFEGTRVSNRSNPLEKRKKETVDALRAIDISSDLVLAGYRALHARVGVTGVVPPAQRLLELVQATGRLPNINTVVDAYNLVSALTRLSLGAHDLAHVRGDLRIGMTRGGERYTPLGEAAPIPVAAGEYAGMDEEKIICRLDIRQCAETRITKETERFMVYVQGNAATLATSLEAAIRQVGDLLVDTCGGRYALVLPER